MEKLTIHDVFSAFKSATAGANITLKGNKITYALTDKKTKHKGQCFIFFQAAQTAQKSKQKSFPINDMRMRLSGHPHDRPATLSITNNLDNKAVDKFNIEQNPDGSIKADFIKMILGQIKNRAQESLKISIARKAPEL